MLYVTYIFFNNQSILANFREVVNEIWPTKNLFMLDIDEKYLFSWMEEIVTIQ